MVKQSKYHAMKRNGKRIDEHRIIMEQHLGRKLTRNEVVHHINENKSDNRIENLQVMSRKKHTSIHSTGHIMSCEEKARRSLMKQGRPNTCVSKLALSDVQEILNLLKKETVSYREVGRRFGVSHTTIIGVVNGQYIVYKQMLDHIRKTGKEYE